MAAGAQTIGEMLEFPVHGDKTGSLVALEKGEDFPFEIKRVYYIWGTAKEAVRGHHAHRNLEQVVVCTSGSCDFVLDDGERRETYHLDSPTQGLHIKNNVWREFTNFSPDCVVMVLASEHYNEADYIRDYGAFLESIGHGGASGSDGRVGLLVLSCGTNANWHIVSTLRERFPGKFRIIGTDTNDRKRVASASLLDAFYKVSPSSSAEFLREIEDVIKNERPDFILPSFDADQRIFHPNAEMLLRHGVKSLSTPEETLTMYSGKKSVIASLAAAGLPVPRIYGAGELEDCATYFVKPDFGCGSIGARTMLGRDISGIEGLDGLVVQEVCSGPEVTMECFAYGGRFSSVCRERLESKAGVCTKARVFKSLELEALGRKFADLFRTPPVFNMQFMKDASGCFVITDVNLRTAGGMGLSDAAGWDETSALAKIMLGRPVDEVFATLPEFLPERHVVRVSRDVVTESSPFTVAFDLDGTLLDSRSRHAVVLGWILSRRGLVADVSGLVEFKRSGRNNVDFLMSLGVPSEQAKDIQEEWIASIENSEFLAGDRLYPDSVELLEKYSGWRRILVTARRNRAGLDETLHRTGLDGFFDAVEVVPPGKNAAAAKAEVLVREKALLFFGDTHSDEAAARLADVKFMFRDCGFHDRKTAYGGVE